MRIAPGARQSSESRELLHGDRLERMTECDARSRLNLDEDDLVAVLRDNVDLALSTSPVSVEDEVPAARQKRRREFFTASAQVVFCCHAASFAAPGNPVSRSSTISATVGETLIVQGE